VEVVDEVGGLAVDVALADPPAAVVLVAGAHLAHVPGPAVPVAHVVVVPPRLAQEAEDRAEERLASHGGGGPSWSLRVELACRRPDLLLFRLPSSRKISTRQDKHAASLVREKLSCAD
jgi:hypothetical protein